MLPILACLGAGALLASAGLLVLARLTAPRFVHDPASSHRALVACLLLASALFVVPWLRQFVVYGSDSTTLATAARPPPPEASVHVTDPSAVGYYVLCLIGAGWVLAAGLASLLAGISSAQLAAVVRRARHAPEPIQAALARCRSPGRRKIHRVLVSDEASVPFAAIPWAPVLVLPSTFHERFDAQALDLTIEHEVTHLERGDLWTSAIVRALGVLFPFNPVALRLANEIAFAREATVDARVATRDPHRYATLLVDVAASARFDQVPRPVSMDDSALQRRIHMLTDASGRRPLSLVPLTAATAVLAMTALSAPSVFAMPIPAPPAFGGSGRQLDATDIHRVTPESSYVACEQKSPGDGCSTADFSGGVCTLDPRDGRLFCAPPPPPDPSAGPSGTTIRPRGVGGDPR
jgi:beta-lactamase regulating signal transducer with metallopeptidase domain